jgi:hypothetical protein
MGIAIGAADTAAAISAAVTDDDAIIDDARAVARCVTGGDIIEHDPFATHLFSVLT